MKNQDGLTLIEMMVVLGIATILSGIAVLNIKKFDQASSNAANEISAQIKSARSYAMTSTTTVQIKPFNATSIRVSSGATCSTTSRTNIPELALTLPDGASLPSTTWTLCYTSRGLSRESLNIQVNDRSRTKTVQVVLGGGIRVL